MEIHEHEFGLYLTLEEDGYIKRTLISESGAEDLPATRIQDEVILFSELNFKHYTMVVDTLQEMADQIDLEGKDEMTTEEKEKFDSFISLVDNLLIELEKEQPTQGLLLRTTIQDSLPINDDSAEYAYLATKIIPEQLRAIVDYNFFLNSLFINVYIKNPIIEDTDLYFISTLKIQQELTFIGTLTTRYFFRSLVDYFVFLTMQFLNTKPTVTRCECCGRFFVPKTNKATKYCDRIVKNNLTCKQIAPSLKHKKIVSDDKVVEAYDRNKRKMYRRYERNDGKVYMPKKGLTYDDFYDWNDTATEARDKYLNGTISAEEALKIIEVND